MAKSPRLFGIQAVLMCLLPVDVYSMHKLHVFESIFAFYTGAGRYSRILATCFCILNWKSLPFVWNIRIWHTMILHLLIRDFHRHTPDKLFHPVISESHTSIGELDYRWHKSNSIYLADLDISRSHLVSHLLARSGHLAFRNTKTGLVKDPSDPSKPARGAFYIGIGGVHCQFKREIKPYQKYEMWSQIVSWDNKRLYIATYFVKKGTIMPRSWHDQSSRSVRRTAGKPEDWKRNILTSALTTYIFRLGRLTIHPAIMLRASGLLPERPGGWLVDTNESAEMGNALTSEDESLGWARENTEKQRQKGLKYAQHFNAMDGLSECFDGGENGALGRLSLG